MPVGFAVLINEWRDWPHPHSTPGERPFIATLHTSASSVGWDLLGWPMDWAWWRRVLGYEPPGAPFQAMVTLRGPYLRTDWRVNITTPWTERIL